MAPVCILCKQAISLAHPARPVNNEWRHFPSCPKPAQRTSPLQRIAQLWRSVMARLGRGRRRL